MTELQFWKMIADAEIVQHREDWRLRVQRNNCYWRSAGICSIAEWALDFNVQISVQKKVESLPHDSEGYCWPITQEGMEQRKAFARKMLEMEVWRIVADSEVFLDESGFWRLRVLINGESYLVTGICTVALHAGNKAVELEIQKKMEHIPLLPNQYHWPLTEEGMQQRKAFAKRMLEQC